ncbi:ArnT family glycosyltransferase [Listeria costaricensis]|uniref:ArnT family glycosyltransferase n=1 Tax=Listeria costaricensis TaxID=2026604 RepID=UPI000C080298|nr:glycosyltransferase family 39 protein [Listeria costaricensis]
MDQSRLKLKRRRFKISPQYIILLVFSLIAMLIFSKSSPLYFFNDWVDSNAFFTMGKGMVHGLVPYQDLFEQKGPLLYLLHAIAYIISPTSFFGVYIIESISLSITLFLFYKISRLYLNPNVSLLITFLTPALLLSRNYFKFGDSAEEFALPFLMGLLYLVFKLCKERNKIQITPMEYFIQGILMGAVFWMKYTLIGAWIIFFIFIGLYLLIKKDFSGFFKAVLYSSLGFIAISLPWLVYFGIHGAIGDMIKVYFLFNMFMYPPDITMIGKFFNSFVILFNYFKNNLLLFLGVMIGMGTVLYSDKLAKKIHLRMLLFSMFLGTSFFAFYGGKTYIYYVLILAPFALIGILSIFVILQKKTNIKMTKHHFFSYLTITFVLGLMMTFLVNDNIIYSKFFPNNVTVQLPNKDNTTPNAKVPAQVEFAEIMNNKKENPTLLNYGNIDYGFYLEAGITPNVRFFEVVNIPYDVYPTNLDEQNRYIKEKKVDFVVVGGDINDEVDEIGPEILHENYQPIAVHAQQRENRQVKYVLFEKK